jgi:hypothetical protein
MVVTCKFTHFLRVVSRWFENTHHFVSMRSMRSMRGGIIFLFKADTYDKLSDNFVRFLRMLANSASTNSCLYQPSSQDYADPSHDSFQCRASWLFNSRAHFRRRC